MITVVIEIHSKTATEPFPILLRQRLQILPCSQRFLYIKILHIHIYQQTMQRYKKNAQKVVMIQPFT